MPLYTTELELLKRELSDVRSVSRFSGYISKEYQAGHYKKIKYSLSEKVKAYMQIMISEQERDLLVYAKDPSHVNLETAKAEDDDLELENKEGELEETEELESTEEEIVDDNYFGGQEVELLFSRVAFSSHHDIAHSDDLRSLDNPVIMALDKIFNYEIERLKVHNKSLFNNVSLMQKVNKTHAKIKAGKIQEASSLISRFYNENKQEILLGYLYLEILFAKAALGSQKSLSIARDVANTVCFLTDKSDENLTSYYRYIYVCREFVHDKEKALQLLRDFVLVDADRLMSNEALVQRDGFYMKCVILFLRFDPRGWNSFEIENMNKFINESLAGGVFYIYFIRDKLLGLIDTVRFKRFLMTEINLFNIYDSHSRFMEFIKANYTKRGIPKHGPDGMYTVAEKYIQNFLLLSKMPDFSDFLTNTSIAGTKYLEHTANDRYLQSYGMSTNSFWRSWVAKITYETSLQNPNILPVELIVGESKLLSKYKALVDKAYEYEKDILNLEKYQSVKELLTDVRTDAIMSAVFGENKYNPMTYGLLLDSMRDYYDKLTMITNVNSNLVSGLIIERGKQGLFWNLEEIQLMLDSLNLTIDNKQVGVKARLDKLKNSKNNEVEAEYTSLAEHLGAYWWVYILLVSLIVVLFNMIF